MLNTQEVLDSTLSAKTKVKKIILVYTHIILGSLKKNPNILDQTGQYF